MELDRYRPILNNRVYPNTSLEQARADVAWYKACGYSGFAINGRAKEPINDLMDWLPGFLDSCKNYVQAAKEAGMNVWIFDEWGYPSGTACGQVLAEERFRSKKYRICYDLILEPGQAVRLPLPEHFVSACAFPVDYHSFYSPKGKGIRIFPEGERLYYVASSKTRLVAVGWEYLSFVTHTMKKHTEDDPTVGTIDVISREAVAKFLRCMHEWYAEPLGAEFGKTVQGFFYDEPEICYDFPYTEELSEAFRQQHGYPLEDILPELLAWKSNTCLISINDAHARLQQEFTDYSNTWNDLLARNFYGQIQQWCHTHNLLSVGHQDLDNNLETLRTVSGDFWKNNRYNDRPGIDVIWDQIAPDKFVDFPRYAGCAKRTYGASGAISETFGEMGPCMYPDRMRYIMEQQILRGVDQFFLYANHDPEDLNVRHFAAAVNDRITRTAQLCNRGTTGAQTAIYVPMDNIAFWANHKDPHLHNTNPQAWQAVDALAQQLCYFPMDYDYAWQGTLDTLIARGIRTLLLAAQTELSAQEAAAARAFAAQGGQIVSIGKPCLPLEDIAQHYPLASQWLQQQNNSLQLQGIGENTLRISMTTRHTEDGMLYFLLNESNSPAIVNTHVSQSSWLELDQTSGVWQAADMHCLLYFEARELKIFCCPDKPVLEKPLQRSGERILTNWTFTGPDGISQHLDRLKPWTELGLADYTGWVTYEAQFLWDGGMCELDLGDVRFSAIVYLDDEEIPLPLAPHRVQRDLSSGTHTLQIRVLNSNANWMYSGPDNGRSNFTGPYWMRFQYERAYRECGLLGPVRIRLLK